MVGERGWFTRFTCNEGFVGSNPTPTSMTGAEITAAYVILAIIGVLLIDDLMWVAVILEFFHGHLAKVVLLIILILLLASSE